jgi:ABC-type nitrate/sulfonate/bicarbonate transport system substrate-binding protein
LSLDATPGVENVGLVVAKRQGFFEEAGVDAIFGGSQNVEGIELEARGLKPLFTSLRRFGVPPFEQGVLLGDSTHLPNADVLSRLLSAVARGTAAAIEDPAAAAEAISAEYSERRCPCSRKAAT